MADTARIDWTLGAAHGVVHLVEADGSAAHPHRRRLLSSLAIPRDLADAVHALCAVHGEHPGMAAAALARSAQPEAAGWLGRIVDAFNAERGYLARLASAAGPLPSTPGHAESEAALVTQRHALEMLAQSDRRGCATGAVAALVADWPAVRTVLDHAAQRFGVPVFPAVFPTSAEIAASLAALAAGPAGDRALAFGAQQLLAQHRSLWDLLEARASARDG